MPIDPNIALGVRPVELESPINAMAKIYAIKNAAQENQMRQMQMQQLEESNQRQNALRAALQGIDITSPEGLAAARNAYVNAGDVKGYHELATGQAALSKAQREAAAAQIKLASDQIDLGLRYLSSAVDQPTYDAARQAMQARGLDTSQMPAAFDPAYKQSELQKGIAAKDQLPKFESFDVYGRGRVTGTVNPLSGQFTQAGTYAEGARAPSTVVNVANYTPASEEAQKEFMKSTRATYDTLKTTPAAMANIEKAKQLIPSAKGFMGTGGEPLLKAATFLNNRFGMKIDTKGVQDATVLRSMLFTGVLDNLRKLDAQPTAQQQAVLQEALGNIGTDPNALPAVLTAYEDIIRDKVALHNQEVQSATQRGVKFPYDPIIKLPEKATPKAAPERGKAGETLSDVDRQALDWANANPKDPRAAEIKKRLGR